MAASKSDRTGVVQLLSSSGEPKDGVRHNINNGQQLATWLPKTIFQFLASSEYERFLANRKMVYHV